MEPFSAAAAAITLCPLIIQTARQLRKVARSIKYARRELEDLTGEMDLFSSLCDQFMQVTQERMKQEESAASARERLISWAESAKSDFEKLSRRVDALSRDPVYEHSITETVSAHVKWLLNKNHLQYLRNTLVVARQSMIGFTHMYHIKRLDELLARLRIGITSEERTKIEKKEGVTLEQYIKLLEDKLKLLRENAALTKDIAHEAIGKISSKQSHSQNEDYSQHTKELLGFSKAVDRDIKRTLHRSRSRQSNPPSSSSSSSNKRAGRVDSPSQSSDSYAYAQRRAALKQSYERYRHEKRKRASESLRTPPNYVPSLHILVRGNGTVDSKQHPDPNIHASTEKPKVPPISRWESTTGEIESNSVDVSESELEDEQITSDEAAHTGNGKWRPTGPFTGTEPRQLREKRQRGSSSQDRGGSKG